MLIWLEGADTDGRAILRAEEPEDEYQPEERSTMVQLGFPLCLVLADFIIKQF